MGELVQTEIITPQPENPFSRDSLVAIFTDPKFARNIVKLTARLDVDEEGGNEGGFVVFAGNLPEISDIVSNDNKVPFGMHTRQSLKESTPIELLTHDAEEMRKNIVLAIHSHPFGELALYPSVNDLENWEELRLRNPNVIEGVVVKSGNQAKLLLYQRDPNSVQNTYYQQWDEKQSFGLLFRLMRESGIRYQILTFDQRSRKFTQTALKKVMTFAS